MKNRRLLPLLATASLFSALSLGAVSISPAQAQPDTAPKTTKKARGKGAKGGLPPKMMAKIETQLGKPLTTEQKEKLGEAYKARSAATKALNEKFASEVSTITGLTEAQVTEMNKRGGKKAAQ